VPTYAIGDIQGCYRTLKKLLKKIDFDPESDQLWLVGDLVNRGPSSLDVLRWAHEHDGCVTAVLGNHDLHLLARAAGFRKKKNSDTLDDVLEAPDCEELIDWLRCRPVLHREDDFVLVHAGLLPAWTVDEAEELASELSDALAGDDYLTALESIYAKGTTGWDDELEGADRLRALTAIFTRIRTCNENGVPKYGFTGAPEQAPSGLVPWYAVADRASADHTVVFGHWAAHGLRVKKGVVATDSGCVWGGELSAVRIPDLKTYAVSSRD
jgi:bis(5'-nucleosyl)-tetraphosphatase (symmetrical)